MSVAGSSRRAERRAERHLRREARRAAGLTVRHPFASALAAIIVAAAAVVVVGQLAGLDQLGRAFNHFAPGWMLAALLAQIISIPNYVTAYQAVVARETDHRLPRRVTAQLVITGFGAFAVAGGFAFDQRTLQRLGLDRRAALLAVLVLGGLEFLSLVWLAFVAALVALVDDRSLSGAYVWPWLIAVPVGTAIAVMIAKMEHPEDVPAAREFLVMLVTGLSDVVAFARRPRGFKAGWSGIIVYWLADVATLYFALRTFGLRPPAEAVVLAYATGFLLSRRTLPLAGAGFVEVLMTFSLYWAHEPLAPALAAVILYRVLDFVLAAAPALVARVRLETALALRENEVAASDQLKRS